MISRRAIVGGLIAGTSTAAWPLAARAQTSALPVIGFLRSTSPSPELVDSFRRGLQEAGWIDGRTVTVTYRFANGDPDRLRALVAELARQRVALIVGDNVAALAAKAGTTTTPIVFTSGGDPVKSGLVPNLNRPGGQATGVTFFSGLLGTKQLELLRQVVPNATTVAALFAANTPTADAEREDIEAAAKSIGLQIVVVDAATDHDLDTALATVAQRRAAALLVGGSAFLNTHRRRIIAFAAKHALPTMYFNHQGPVDGGLMSYGASLTDAYRQAGSYAGRILKGEKAGDLPVLQATKFEFVINLSTAKAMGLAVPPTVLALADEVIE